MEEPVVSGGHGVKDIKHNLKKKYLLSLERELGQ